MLIGRWKLLLGVTALVGTVGLAAPPAWAGMDEIPVALLEMDGNTADDGTPGIDWDTPSIATLPQVLEHFNMLDSPNPGGLQMDRGSKDDLDVSTWHFKNVDGTITPKDDLQEAWALAAQSPLDGETILYFAARRLGVNGGTTSFGVWVFGSKVDIVTDPLDGDSFSDDEHKQGDGLIVVDVGGSSIEGIRVFEWQNGDGTAGELVETFNAGAADCTAFPVVGMAYQTNVCGRVSADGLFMEVAIDLDDTLSGICVSSAMLTTRTSNEPRASVKNFQLAPDFSLCGITASKVCEVTGLTGIADPLFDADFTVTLTNDGATAIPGASPISITDDAGTPAVPGDDLTLSGFTVQDVIAAGFLTDVGGGTANVWDAGETLDIKLEPVGAVGFPNVGDLISGTFGTNDNPPTNSGVATVTIAGTAFTANFTKQCDPLVLNPLLSVSKECEPRLMTTGGDLAVQVTFEGEVCNRGDIPLTVSVEDNKVVPADNPLVDGVLLAAAEVCFEDDDCSGELDTCDGGALAAEGTCSIGGEACFEDAECSGAETCVGGQVAMLGACADTIVCEPYAGSYMPSSPNQTPVKICSVSGLTCDTAADCLDPGTETCAPSSDKYDPGSAAFSNTVTAVGTNIALGQSCSISGGPCTVDGDCNGGQDVCLVNGVMDMKTDTCELCPVAE